MAEYPDPRMRIRPDPTGTTVVTLADGNPWLLADGGLGNILDPVRDRLFEGARLNGQVTMGDVFEAAGELLLANYELDRAEIASLVMGLGLGEEDRKTLHEGLTKDVMAAMFGAEGGCGYTEWATASLYAAGIHPASVPTPARNSVLSILVKTRRTIPVDEFVTALAQANAFSELRALARPVP